MKFSKSAAIGLAVLGMVIFLSGISFAQESKAKGKMSADWKAKHEAKIKLLQDSATALQQTNPELAKQLSEMVNKETSETKEMEAKKEARTKLFKEAAAALKHTHPDLAKGLEDMATKHKTGMHKMMREKNEKEEAGKKAETK